MKLKIAVGKVRVERSVQAEGGVPIWLVASGVLCYVTFTISPALHTRARFTKISLHELAAERFIATNILVGGIHIYH
jgi:hypothetical protein